MTRGRRGLILERMEGSREQRRKARCRREQKARGKDAASGRRCDGPLLCVPVAAVAALASPARHASLLIGHSAVRYCAIVNGSGCDGQRERRSERRGGMARELQSRGWRVQRRHSGEWRSQGRRRKANGNAKATARRRLRQRRRANAAQAGEPVTLTAAPEPRGGYRMV